MKAQSRPAFSVRMGSHQYHRRLHLVGSLTARHRWVSAAQQSCWIALPIVCPCPNNVPVREDRFEIAKNELVSTTKKTIPGTGGIATSRSSCSPLQRRPTSATKPTPRRPQKRSVAPAATGSSIQEILHVATHLALKQIQQAYIIAIAWSLWRRSHQAAAQQTHIKSKMQL